MSADPPRVLLITDSLRLVPGGSIPARLAALERQAREAFAAGVDAVQIRERDLDGGALFALTRTLAVLGRTIVTDRADVAMAAGAAGVHLRGDGPPPARVRALLHPRMTLSKAVHDADEAALFGRDGALDWVIAGAAFATVSKPGRQPLGASGVRTIARVSSRPVLAVGGVTPSVARELRGSGAAGVAAIGIFLGPITPEDVDRLRDASLE